jgi:hypothetical protein
MSVGVVIYDSDHMFNLTSPAPVTLWICYPISPILSCVGSAGKHAHRSQDLLDTRGSSIRISPPLGICRRTLEFLTQR